MKYCPECKALFGDGFEFCPHDKALLLDPPKETVALYDASMGIILDGKYRVLTPIGSGTLGEVYAASHVTLGKQFAVKFLRKEFVSDPKSVDNFLNLARRQATINSHLLVSLTDFGTTDDGTPYFVMEYCEGFNLSEYIDNIGVFDEKQVVFILSEISNVLNLAHKAGFIHQNLKPSNIKIKEEDGKITIKLMDIGMFSVSGQGTEIAVQKTIFGNPLWMAPEQVLGEIAGAPTDVFSLGLLGYYMLTGVPLFQSGSFSETAKKQLKENPESKIDSLNISDNLKSFLLKALQKDPHERYQNIQLVLDALSNEQVDDIGTDGIHIAGFLISPIKIIAGAIGITVLLIILGFFILKKEDKQKYPENSTTITFKNSPQSKVETPKIKVNNLSEFSKKKSVVKDKEKVRLVKKQFKGYYFYIKTVPNNSIVSVVGAGNYGFGKYFLKKEHPITVNIKRKGYFSKRISLIPEKNETIIIKLRKNNQLNTSIKVNEPGNSKSRELLNPFEN